MCVCTYLPILEEAHSTAHYPFYRRKCQRHRQRSQRTQHKFLRNAKFRAPTTTVGAEAVPPNLQLQPSRTPLLSQSPSLSSSQSQPPPSSRLIGHSINQKAACALPLPTVHVCVCVLLSLLVESTPALFFASPSLTSTYTLALSLSVKQFAQLQQEHLPITTTTTTTAYRTT